MRAALPMGKAAVLQMGCTWLKQSSETIFLDDFVNSLCNMFAQRQSVDDVREQFGRDANIMAQRFSGLVMDRT